jgi:hypothetical protein
VACKDMLQWCMYHVRPLSVYLLRHFTPNRDSMQRVIPLDQSALLEPLTFWSDLSQILQGRSFTDPPSRHLITTDASVEAYVAWSGAQRLSGLWDAKWLPLHINLKEMQAVFLFWLCRPFSTP